MTSRLTHEQLKNRALSNPAVKAEYDALQEEYSLLEELMVARQKAHMTQSDVAKVMGTTTSVVGRLETGGGKGKHSPTLATLKRYAQALGCDLKIKLVRKKAGSNV